MKICIVTGGSGGHIYPALTYADYVKKHSNYEIFFIGNEDRMESEIIPAEGYDFYPIHNKGLQGSFLDKIKAVFSQFSAIRQAYQHLRVLKPDLVFSFGSYVSVPVAFAARLRGIPVILHEQNAQAGKANKMVARFSKEIITSYPETFANYKNRHYLGNPRSSLVKKDLQNDACERNRIGIKADLKTVLIVMGSQGSTAMTPLFRDYIKNFTAKNYQVVLVTGKRNFADFEDLINEIPNNLYLEPYVDQQELLRHVDLIVARAGASTIAEIQAFSTPAILIPSPHVANNHQYYNAKSLVDSNAAEMLIEKDLDHKRLSETIEILLFDDQRRKEIKENVSKTAKYSAVSDIHSIVEKVVN